MTSISGGHAPPQPVIPSHGVLTSQFAGQIPFPVGICVRHSTAFPMRTVRFVPVRTSPDV